MAERSKRIKVYDEDKLKQINVETLKLLRKYKIDMTIRDLSEKTIYNYESDLNQWLIYVLDNQFNQCVTDLNEDDLTEFLYFCKTEGNNVERMKRRMSSISAFYKFLRKKKIITENPMEFLDRPKRGQPITVQTFLLEEDVSLMREKLIACERPQIRLYALLSLSTMARVNAIANLRWDQLDLDNRVFNDVLEKEGKIVTLFFSDEVKNLLIEEKQRREENNIDDFGWVFISNRITKENPISTGTLNEWCKYVGELIGYQSLHPHDFRHSGANLLKRAGMSLEDISYLLNHSGTDVTKKHYLKVDADKVSENKDKFKI